MKEIIEAIKKLDKPKDVKKVWSEVVKHYRFLKKDYFAKVEQVCAGRGKEFSNKKRL